MKLYVCWGTFRPDRGHPCGEAHEALVTAGYEPEVIKTGGCYRTDPIFPGRREVKRLTGNYKVPTLVLDDGTIIDGSQNIIEWAQALEAAGLVGVGMTREKSDLALTRADGLAPPSRYFRPDYGEGVWGFIKFHGGGGVLGGGRTYAKVTPKVGDGFVCRADRAEFHF